MRRRWRTTTCFRAEVEALPPEERRPHLFTHIFAEGHATSKLPELLDVARAFGPDLIVYESGDLAAPAVAAALQVPVANHSFGVDGPVRGACSGPRSTWRRSGASVGAEPDEHAGAFRGLYIDVSPPSFAWEQPLGDSIRLGHVPVAQLDAPDWLDALEQPLVYVTLGTVFNRPATFRALLDGLDGSSALVTTGRNVDPDVARRPSRRTSGSSGSCRRRQILPRCAAVVAHAGSGSVIGSLAHGLPLVLVPQGADQFDNAARCAAPAPRSSCGRRS